MTRKLNALVAAAALVAGTSSATAVFAAESTSAPPPRTQGEMAQMNPDQMKQMGMVPASRSNAPIGPGEEHRYATPRHSNPSR
jgi:Spy/CpxP family protein refolding chaperone